MNADLRTESWDAMSARHRQERLALVLAQRDLQIIQTDAAKNLGTTLTRLNNFIQSRSI
jgi:hypothetical protein